MISLTNIDRKNIHLFEKDILEIERSSFPSPWSANAFKEEIGRSFSYLWALITDTAFAGYICFWMFANEIHLMNIAVHPEKRGNGLGRYLLTKMIEAGESEGVETVWLEVRPSNRIAIILYERMGFKEIGRRSLYYTDTREDAIVMSLSLLKEKVNHEKCRNALTFGRGLILDNNKFCMKPTANRR